MSDLKEYKLEITKNGEHNNIVVKTRYEWDKKAKKFKVKDGNKIVVQQGIPVDHFVVVEKVNAEGYPHDGEFGTSYSCKVRYNGEEVSFWLTDKKTQKPYSDFAACGGAGDKIKISCVEEVVKNRMGNKEFVEVLKFEKV